MESCCEIVASQQTQQLLSMEAEEPTALGAVTGRQPVKKQQTENA
jgi:hypothetical protein